MKLLYNSQADFSAPVPNKETERRTEAPAARPVEVRSDGSLLVAILNRGFGREALRLAEGCGARGVTFLQGAGNNLLRQDPRPADKSIERKEMVFVVCSQAVCADILQSFQTLLGLTSPAHGIFFELPVRYAVGLARAPLQFLEREEGGAK